MTGLRRTSRIGKVLAAGALIGLAGCQQIPSHPGAPLPMGFGNEPRGGGTTITPAQEADVQISMGRAAEQQGDLDQAMAAYRAALDRDKSRADAYARLAILHDKQGKFRESAELYHKALALRPGDPEIFCDMGYSFYLQRRWAEAEMNLRQSLAVNPDHRRAHNNLALLLVRDNRLDDALAEFGKAGSDPVRAHMNLAFALTTEQRWEPARAEYQRALAIDPSSQLAKARFDELNILLAKREPSSPPLLDAARRDPALLTTAAVSPSPPQQYRPVTQVAIPSVPAAAPLRVNVGARAAIPPPRPFVAPVPAWPDANHPVASTPIPPPRRISAPGAATPGIALATASARPDPANLPGEAPTSNPDPATIRTE